MLRDMSLAYFFGTSGIADAFRVSLLATLVLTTFFMEDVLSGAFVPLYVRFRSHQFHRAGRLLRFTAAYLLVVSMILVAVIWFGAGLLLNLIAPGMSPESRGIAVQMVRWMCLGVPFYCLSALISLYGICINRFRPIALRPAFQNASLLLVIPVAALSRNPGWIGLGFPIAFAVYLGYVIWEFRGSWSVSVPASSVHEIGGEGGALFRTALPLVYMMALGQLLAVVDRAAASFVGVGAIASLEYARVFVESPHVLVGAAIATTALSRFSGRGQDEISERAPRLILSLLTCSLGLMAILEIAAPELVSVVYQHGKFDAAGAESVTHALRGLSVGGAFMTTSYLMNRVLSSQLRNRESILPMFVCLLVAALSNVLLARPLGVFGVGLAMTIAYAVMCALLARRLGILRAMWRRTPVWVTAGALTYLTAIAIRQIGVPAIARLALFASACGLTWLVGIGLFPSGRVDLAVLVEQGRRLREHRLGRWAVLGTQS